MLGSQAGDRKLSPWSYDAPNVYPLKNEPYNIDVWGGETLANFALSNALLKLAKNAHLSLFY